MSIRAITDASIAKEVVDKYEALSKYGSHDYFSVALQLGALGDDPVLEDVIKIVQYDPREHVLCGICGSTGGIVEFQAVNRVLVCKGCLEKALEMV